MKRLLALAMAFAMALTLAACGSKDNTQQNIPSGPSQIMPADENLPEGPSDAGEPVESSEPGSISTEPPENAIMLYNGSYIDPDADYPCGVPYTAISGRTIELPSTEIVKEISRPRFDEKGMRVLDSEDRYVSVSETVTLTFGTGTIMAEEEAETIASYTGVKSEPAYGLVSSEMQPGEQNRGILGSYIQAYLLNETNESLALYKCTPLALLVTPMSGVSLEGEPIIGLLSIDGNSVSSVEDIIATYGEPTAAWANGYSAYNTYYLWAFTNGTGNPNFFLAAKPTENELLMYYCKSEAPLDENAGISNLYYVHETAMTILSDMDLY